MFVSEEHKAVFVTVPRSGSHAKSARKPTTLVVGGIALYFLLDNYTTVI